MKSSRPTSSAPRTSLFNPNLAFLDTFGNYGLVVERSMWKVRMAHSTRDLGRILRAIGTGITWDLIAPGDLFWRL